MSRRIPKPLEMHKIRIGKKVWRVCLCAAGDMPRGLFGDCDNVTERNPIIRIRAGQSPFMELDTFVHEALHATCPEFDEDTVASRATCIAKILSTFGYARNPPREKE